MGLLDFQSRGTVSH